MTGHAPSGLGLFGLHEFPGRCPGLTNGAPLGLEDSRACADADNVIRLEVRRVVGGVAGIAALVAGRVVELVSRRSSDADSPRCAGTENSSRPCASASPCRGVGFRREMVRRLSVLAKVSSLLQWVVAAADAGTRIVDRQCVHADHRGCSPTWDQG